MVREILAVFPDARVSSGYVRIRCPYHKDGKEKRPSMSILLEKRGDMEAGTCHCFACSKVVSIAELFDFLGVKHNFNPVVSRRTKPEVVSLTTTPSTYKPQLPFRFSPYLAQRGIGEEVQKLFKIYEKDNRVFMPVFDREGKYLYVNSRCTDRKQFYVEGGAVKTLWGIEEINLSRPIVVCEGQIDAMSFWELGMQAVATLGTGNIKALDALKTSTSIFILAFDGDDSGRQATKKAAKLLGSFRCRYIEFPEGKDINNLLVDIGNKERVLRYISEHTYKIRT